MKALPEINEFKLMNVALDATYRAMETPQMKGLDSFTQRILAAAFPDDPPCCHCGCAAEDHESEFGHKCNNCDDCPGYEPVSKRDLERDEPYEGND